MLLVQPLNLLNQQAQLLVKLPSSNYKEPSKLHPTVEADSQLTMLLYQVVENSLILMQELACGGKPSSQAVMLGYSQSKS
jgi:hypothetical protein